MSIKMKTRIISAAIMLALFIPCLFLSHTLVFDVVLTLLCIMSVFEMLRCTKNANNLCVCIPAYLLALMPLFVRAVNTKLSIFEIMVFAFIVFFFIAASGAVFSHGKYSIQRVSNVVMLVLYIVFGFTSIIAVRSLENGKYLFMLIFVAAWLSDTGAYFVGVFFGKHKLIPDVSPKKTIEGAIGGLLTCVVSFLIYAIILKFGFKLSPNFLVFAFLGFIMSLISMCGDLIASLVKRTFKIKDYGNFIPGHGGILDRFDSIIAVSSIMFVLLSLPFIYTNLL